MTKKLLCGLTTFLLGTACVGVSAHRSQPPDPSDVTTCFGQIVPAGPDGLLDDFEDGNNQLAAREGRGGYWWRSADSSGSGFLTPDVQPVAGGAAGSKLAQHQAGKTASGGEAWGVNFGANFVTAGLYDASKYVGLRFRAKVGPGSTRNVRLKIGDVNTHPSAGPCKTCWNHFGKDLSLTEEWREYQVLFAGLQQAEGWGDPRPSSVSPNKLFSLDFTVGPGQSFDVWVDDLEFLTCK